MEHFDILIVGAGAAGIAAAGAAWDAGCRSVLLVDRRSTPGGILLQCSHRGFGADMTGPEYTEKMLRDFPEGICFASGTTVLSVSSSRTALLSGGRGVSFSQLVLAAGCLEVPLGKLPVVGTRPRGVYTAGQMQEMMNLHGFLPEGPAVILGSGDLGLIMAAQLAACGLEVTVVEQKESCGGMARNRRALERFPVDLRCGVTVSRLQGDPDLESCTLTDGTVLPCKTLLLAVGLRPDRELIRELEPQPWLHLCGNCSIVQPMVESVVADGKKAGLTAWNNIRGAI